MEHWAAGSRPFLPPDCPNTLKRSSCSHVPRSILSPGGEKEGKRHPEGDCLRLLESSQRVRAGQEDCNVGASTKNFVAPWVYAVVTFLHKDVFKQPIRVDWAAQYSNKTMRHMLQGRMSCLWAPRHSESPMLVINIHQAGSATLELQQRIWMALQGIRAKYPDIQLASLRVTLQRQRPW